MNKLHFKKHKSKNQPFKKKAANMAESQTSKIEFTGSKIYIKAYYSACHNVRQNSAIKVKMMVL